MQSTRRRSHPLVNGHTHQKHLNQHEPQEGWRQPPHAQEPQFTMGLPGQRAPAGERLSTCLYLVSGHAHISHRVKGPTLVVLRETAVPTSAPLIVCLVDRASFQENRSPNSPLTLYCDVSTKHFLCARPQRAPSSVTATPSGESGYFRKSDACYFSDIPTDGARGCCFLWLCICLQELGW